MIKVSPSIIAGDLADIKGTMTKLKEAGADYLHVDVMDGHFVPNLTLGPLVIKSMRRYSDMVFDVHLMISNPGKYIADYAEAGADIIGIHHEIDDDRIKLLEKIRSMGKRVEIVYSPDTDLSTIEEYFPYVDQILIMSVFPGFSGQKFIENSLSRGREVKDKIDKSGYSIDLEIDGGICAENAAKVKKAGFNVLVSGSSVMNSNDMAKTIKAIKEA